MYLLVLNVNRIGNRINYEIRQTDTKRKPKTEPISQYRETYIQRYALPKKQLLIYTLIQRDAHKTLKKKKMVKA